MGRYANRYAEQPNNPRASVSVLGRRWMSKTSGPSIESGACSARNAAPNWRSSPTARYSPMQPFR